MHFFLEYDDSIRNALILLFYHLFYHAHILLIFLDPYSQLNGEQIQTQEGGKHW